MFKISLFKRGFVFTDSIFYSHFILAVIFLISQVTRMWESTQGISSSNYLMKGSGSNTLNLCSRTYAKESLTQLITTIKHWRKNK